MGVKLLHTADWHLGKRLHGYDLSDEHRFFMDWLLEFIKERDVNYLLISGDVFDFAYPSAETRQMYFDFIKQLYKTGCSLIITGGNHDSPAELNSSKEVLKVLNVHVIGSMPEEITDVIIEIKNATGKVNLIVAAIPFLRDRDLRKSVEGENYENKVEAVRLGIQRYYNNVADYCSRKYSNLPVIAMGHLYTQGAVLSESERDIQIGNQASFDASFFPKHFNYVALGHIHKPQAVINDGRIRYSGSPISLSFSEADNEKKVILLEYDNGRLKQDEIEVIRARNLVTFRGTLKEVRKKATNYQKKFPLSDLGQIIIEEDNYDSLILTEKDLLIQEINEEGNLKIIHHRILFKNRPLPDSEILGDTTRIHTIKPQEIFETLIKDYGNEEREELKVAFLKLAEEAAQYSIETV